MNQDSLVRSKDGGLFQSNLWKGFQIFQGKEVFGTDSFFGVREKTQFGSMGYIPRGPELWDQGIVESLRKSAAEHDLYAIRIEPQSSEVLAEIQKSFSVHKSTVDVQPREFLMMNIEPEQEELFASMKSKWRYNIRLAQKQGVVIAPSNITDEQEAFVTLMAATAERKGIHFHKAEYYKIFTEFFSGEKGELLLAKKDGRVLAGAALVYYQNTAYYVHGGSSDDGRGLMAPHLLQWEGILRAKARGCTQYDFGGAAVQLPAPTGKDWSGITRFKQGFAPSTKTTVLPGAYDIIFHKNQYLFYRILEAVKKLLKSIGI